jgi:hypothetical protein
MGEVVMPFGKTAQRYGMRGARAAAKVNNKLQRLVRVDGEAYTMAQVLERVAAPEKTVREVINKCQGRGQPVTWERLHNIKVKPTTEAANV